jgi:protein-tyrosine phosphatase
MIDIHCHILPNVDDGPQSLDESLAMARFCVEDGIRYVVATPHCHRYIHLLRSDILPKVAELNRELELANIPLTVLPGSEIQVTDSAEYRREFEAGLLCHLGDGRSYTLLEFNWVFEQFPHDAVALITWIRDQGFVPILAHPERHSFLDQDPQILQVMIDRGAWIQITVDSLLGNHGSAPKRFGEMLLTSQAEAILATDAHNMSRCSGLSAGYSWVQEHYGQDRADDLRARADRIQTSLLSP